MEQRVVITGMGVISPVGNNITDFWHSLVEGHCGIDHIKGYDEYDMPVSVAGQVKDFKPGDRVLIAAITPDWNSLEAQGGYAMHSGGMLSGWKFSNFKDGVFAEYFHVNDADGNLAHLPEGMDLAAPTGTPIHASDGGRIIKANYWSGHGLCVEIDHGNGVITRYSHCSAVFVSIDYFC